MNNLAILSKHALQYSRLLEQANLDGLKIKTVSAEPNTEFDYSDIDIVFGDPDLTAQIIHRCPKLKWLQSTWAGNAPLFAAGKTDYQLCGVKGVFSQAMQEYVFSYLLYFCRNIEGFKQAQLTKKWQAASFGSLASKTLGIMGVGDIGQAVAQMAKQFSMDTKGYTRTSRNCQFIDQYYSTGQEQKFAEGLDFLLCLLPDSAATAGLVNHSFLSFLPKHAVLINAGRGATIDDNALLAALNTKQLKAAVLDVFNQEPLAPEHPFWHTENLFITQHTAATSHPAQISPLFITNYLRYIKGLALDNQLDFGQGY